MPKQVTVAANNRYCQARIHAGQYNQKLLSRAGAAEELGCISEDSLKKYELDLIRPPSDVVALMADAYNQPELRSWYCANECPLGKDRVAEIELLPLDDKHTNSQQHKRVRKCNRPNIHSCSRRCNRRERMGGNRKGKGNPNEG
ncbi:MAG: hypothetical protein BWY46_01395 [Firmicutes bacterium ADurb.Bin300]|nr:MAG: hypothetical protein BWY46_01395 [Firmicutes bacterium ADurb.Bin300]